MHPGLHFYHCSRWEGKSLEVSKNVIFRGCYGTPHYMFDRTSQIGVVKCGLLYFWLQQHVMEYSVVLQCHAASVLQRLWKKHVVTTTAVLCLRLSGVIDTFSIPVKSRQSANECLFWITDAKTFNVNKSYTSTNIIWYTVHVIFQKIWGCL